MNNRRQFLKGLAATAVGGLMVEPQGLFAEALTATPGQTEGPYYPTTLPLDTDNDLVVINNNLTSAVGEITYLSGRILQPNGDPVRNATIEIWQADNSGAYIHPSSVGYATRDLSFQGYGRFLTGSSGEYLFRTIKPGLYPGRTRHIHFKVRVQGFADLTSQVYVLGEPQNAGDGILNGIRDTAARNSVVVPFVPISGSSIGALAARFDVVVSVTPSAAPRLTMTNMTDPTRTGYLVGDNWRLDLKGASPGTPVFLHLWKNNVDLGISGPYGQITDTAGAWSMTGSYGLGDVGSWQLQAVIGSAASTETSSSIGARIAVN